MLVFMKDSSVASSMDNLGTRSVKWIDVTCTSDQRASIYCYKRQEAPVAPSDRIFQRVQR